MKVRLVVAARQLQDYYREGIMHPMRTRRHDKPTAALRSDQTCESCDLFVLRHWPRHYSRLRSESQRGDGRISGKPRGVDGVMGDYSKDRAAETDQNPCLFVAKSHKTRRELAPRSSPLNHIHHVILPTTTH